MFRRRRGFTLIELLVVISIIALLVGLLLPALSSARAVAQAVQCSANFHGLGIAVQNYITDYHQMPGMNFNSAWIDASDWGGAGGAYLASSMGAWCAIDYGGMPWVYGEGGTAYTNRKSGPTDIGYVWPYINGSGTVNPATDNSDPRAKLFYCPANPASFNPVPGGFPGRPNSLYSTWTGTGTIGFPGATYNGYADGAAQQEFGQNNPNFPTCTATSYMWRAGAYAVNNNLPDTDPTWAGPGANWVSWYSSRNASPGNGIPGPDDPIFYDRALLTDWWAGYSPTPVPWIATRPHQGVSTNVMFSDGSSRVWKPGPGQTIAFDNYDRCFSLAAYSTTTRSQWPFQWVLIERALRSNQ